MASTEVEVPKASEPTTLPPIAPTNHRVHWDQTQSPPETRKRLASWGLKTDNKNAQSSRIVKRDPSPAREKAKVVQSTRTTLRDRSPAREKVQHVQSPQSILQRNPSPKREKVAHVQSERTSWPGYTGQEMVLVEEKRRGSQTSNGLQEVHAVDGREPEKGRTVSLSGVEGQTLQPNMKNKAATLPIVASGREIVTTGSVGVHAPTMERSRGKVTHAEGNGTAISPKRSHLHVFDKNGDYLYQGPNMHAQRVVVCQKGAAGLGLRMTGGSDYKGMPNFISLIVDGGAADATGALFVGDAILRVNDIDTEHATHDLAMAALRESGTEAVLTVKFSQEACDYISTCNKKALERSASRRSRSRPSSRSGSRPVSRHSSRTSINEYRGAAVMNYIINRQPSRTSLHRPPSRQHSGTSLNTSYTYSKPKPQRKSFKPIHTTPRVKENDNAEEQINGCCTS